MTYRPQEHGALCDQCPLQGNTAVAPELHRNARLLCVAEAPGGKEVDLGRPLVGPSGAEHERAVRAAGAQRSDCSYTNTILCRPPGRNGLKGYLAYVAKRNKRRKSNGKELMLLPTEACRPRLMREIREAPALLLMGAYAKQALAEGEGGEEGFLASRGFPSKIDIEGRSIPTLSTVHPALVLRQRRWTYIYRADVDKALRMAAGRLRWKDPEMVVFPTPDQLRDVLRRLDASNRPVSYDVETDGLEPLTANLRCIGIGNDELCTCIPFTSIRGGYICSPAVTMELEGIILDWFAQHGSVCAHNGLYDNAVMAARKWLCGREFVMGRRMFDTVIAHHIAWSEWRHNLGFLEAQYTDREEHKDVNHDAWPSDRELHIYCMLDVAVTSRGASRLAAESRFIRQVDAFRIDTKLSAVCQGMHAVGLQLDTIERDVQYRRLGFEMEKYKAQVRAQASAIAKTPMNINPGSPPQLRAFLFDRLGIEPVPENAGGLTDTGEPAVGKDQLFTLIDTGLPDAVEEFLLSIIDYKEAQKLRGTYCSVQPMRDGRLRPTWSPHIVVSGRLACSGPNVMNVPYAMRAMYHSRPGHKLVFCDKGQLEARICAWFAQDTGQIEAFLGGADMHMVTASILLKKPVEEVSKKERKFAKTFKFACQYLAGVKKVHQMVRNFRDTDGTRPFRSFSRRQADAAFNEFWAAHEKIMAYHEKNRAFFDEHGYLAEPIHGRRRYFMDATQAEDEKEELANYIIQSCLPRDTRVATRSGMLPIGDIAPQGEVWTGQKWAPYERLSMGTCEIGELRLDNRQRLRCDTRHKVLVVGEDGYEFRQWSDLAPGDRICTSRAQVLTMGDASAVDQATAYWMGFAVGNGCTTQRNALAVTFGDRKNRYTKEEKKEQFRRWVEARGYTPQKDRTETGSITVCVEAIEFRRWWERELGYHWGEKAHTKRIPDVIWRANWQSRTSFLLGLLDADGCVKPSRHPIYAGSPNLHMCQPELLREVQMLARTVGVRSNLSDALQGGISWRLAFNQSHLAALGYGTCIRRPKSRDLVPPFVVAEFVRRAKGLRAKRRTSKATLLHRLRSGGTTSVDMFPSLCETLGVGCPEVYATERLREKVETGVVEETFTLSVDDPSHRYDSEGVISKNCASADVNDATFRIVDEFPWGFDGPHTGLVHQCHDALGVECREENAEAVAMRMQDTMFSMIGDMPLPVDVQIGPSWGVLTEYERDGDHLIAVD